MKILLSCIMVFFAFNVDAQRIQEEIKNIKSNKVQINSEFFDTHVKTWDKNYISIDAKVTPSKKGYIKNIDVVTENNDSRVLIKTDFEFNKSVSNYVSFNMQLTIYLPENMLIDVVTEFGDLIIEGKYQKYDIDCQFGDAVVAIDNADSLNNSEFDIGYGDFSMALSNNDHFSFDIDSEFGDVFTNLDLIFTGDHTYKLNDGDNKVEIDIDYGDLELIKR